jgi:predicted nucleotidyltransferase component of viral defense system
MAFSPDSTLTTLQVDTLRAFFERERDFFLTGGAALAGFHLGHRHTDDLDLFTTDDEAFARGRRVLAEVAIAVGGILEIRQDTPRFVRAVITRGDGALVVDLVHDYQQSQPAKLEIDGIRVDPPTEILVNKLGTIVSRAEERDLVDLFALERSGLRVEDALAAALAKDGGCTPATLAWLLSEVVIPEDLELPRGITAAELRAYVSDLVVRLRKLALPGG